MLRVIGKKGNKLAFALGAVGAAGAVMGSLAATRVKQEKAREEGQHVPYGPYEALFKRPFDVVLSVGALTVLSPVILVTSIAVRVKLGSPVVFMQKRPGLNGEPFTMYKFRSMSSDTDETGSLLPDAERLTSFGRMLRSTSLDELPELINIVKGDMSIVGPRPFAVSYLPYYSDLEMHRHDVRPGLTGLAQINGRTALQWEDRFAHDLNYVDKVSLRLDASIVYQTVFKVLKKQDVVIRGEGDTCDFDDYRRSQHDCFDSNQNRGPSSMAEGI